MGSPTLDHLHLEHAKEIKEKPSSWTEADISETSADL